MADVLVMGRLAGKTASGDPIVAKMGGPDPDRAPHALCDQRSWCQPADVAYAAIIRDDQRRHS